MCDEGRTNDRHQPGRATRIIHLLLVVLFFAPICAAGVTAQSSTFLGIQNASDNVAIYDTPTPIPETLPPEGSITGFVLDARGNKIPGAYMTLDSNDSSIPIMDNPVFSGNTGNDLGAFYFTGLAPGNYTIEAEKSDVQLFNGTATARVLNDAVVSANIILSGYVFSPPVKDTPTAAPTVEPVIVSTPAITLMPTTMSDDIIGRAKEKALGPAIGIFIIAIAGAGFMVLRDLLKPKAKKKIASHKPAQMDKTIDVTSSTKEATVPLLKDETVYAQEIRELAKRIASGGYGDIETLNGINALSKKYGIDQNRIFMDIKKVKIGKP